MGSPSVLEKPAPNHTLRDVFAHSKLPTNPVVGRRVAQQFAQANFELKTLADTVRFDPGLMCAFVGQANSKSNGLREVCSIQNAILICGPSESLEILRQCELIENSNELAPYQEMFEFGWANCISQAVAAESLREFGFTDDACTMFLTGLMIDIGVLALMRTYPLEYHRKVWTEIKNGKCLQDLCQLERDTFGFSHVTVGHELGRRWRLGESFSSAILQHHQHVSGSFFSMISQAASKIVEALDCKSEQAKKRAELDEHLSVCFQVTSDQVDTLLNTVDRQRKESLAELGLGAYSSIQ